MALCGGRGGAKRGASNTSRWRRGGGRCPTLDLRQQRSSSLLLPPTSPRCCDSPSQGRKLTGSPVCPPPPPHQDPFGHNLPNCRHPIPHFLCLSLPRAFKRIHRVGPQTAQQRSVKITENFQRGLDSEGPERLEEKPLPQSCVDRVENRQPRSLESILRHSSLL